MIANRTHARRQATQAASFQSTPSTFHLPPSAPTSRPQWPHPPHASQSPALGSTSTLPSPHPTLACPSHPVSTLALVPLTTLTQRTMAHTTAAASVPTSHRSPAGPFAHRSTLACSRAGPTSTVSSVPGKPIYVCWDSARFQARVQQLIGKDSPPRRIKFGCCLSVL